MFEERTYETLLEEALSLIPNDIDKQEGSLIRTAISPCIYQLAETYIQLDNFIDLVSGDTAVGIYLDRVVADYGLIRKPPTYAIRKVLTSGEVAIGTRWSLNDTTYAITELLSTNTYKAQCEQLGSIGNTYSGTLEAIDYVNNVSGTLTDILISGEDLESDDNLRARFYSQIQAPSTSGNADNYKKWALEVSGVGDAKVFSLWNGNGTVKVLVVDSNMSIDTTLPSRVSSYIETVRPIGSAVTVDSPTGKTIDVTAKIALDGSKTLQEIQNNFIREFTVYLKEMVFESYSLSYAKIGSILLSTPGVADYSNLLVNGGTANISIADTQMPIAGTISLSEVV